MVNMKGIVSIFIIVLISIVMACPVQAGLKKVGQTGLQFLKIDMSARSAGMGSAFTMMGNDANAMFHNPSGLAYFESGYDFTFTRTTWIADISYISGGIAKSFGQWGTVGMHFITADYGKIIGTRIADTERGFEETGNVDVSAYVVGLAYAKRISDKFAMGGQLKYAGQNLGESQLTTDGETTQNKVSGLAYEFGTTFYPGLLESFRFGMSIKNFSQEFQYEQEGFQLPLTYFIGIAFDALELAGDFNNDIHSLMIALDAIHPRDYAERIHLGAEYWFKNMVAVRTGYKFNYDEEGISFGAGLKYNVSGLNLKLDYAYSNFGVFESVNRISIGASF
jgi:hypothetical protein